MLNATRNGYAVVGVGVPVCGALVERRTKEEREWRRWMKKVATVCEEGGAAGGGDGGGGEGGEGSDSFHRRRSMSAGDLQNLGR